MKKYILVFKLGIQQLFEYRFDFVMSSLKYSLMILMMSFIWLEVNRNQINPILSASQTLLYFFWAIMFYGFSNFHTVYIEEDIRLGFLTKYLLRPISPFWNYFFYELARTILESIIKLVVIIPILLLMGFQLDIQLSNVLLVVLFLPWIYVFSFNLLSMISSFCFWLKEAYALRWAIMIVFRFLAGLLVPIMFFPQAAQIVLQWLPFQHLAYTPISILMNQSSWQVGVKSLFILIGWTILLHIIRASIWKKGEYIYEGTGI